MCQPWESEKRINNSTKKELKRVARHFCKMAIMSSIIYTSFIILSINKRRQQPRSSL